MILAADGVNSRIRDHFEGAFPAGGRDQVEPLLLDGLHPADGRVQLLLQARPSTASSARTTYQYETGRSTWIFEMDEACWRGHGFDGIDEEHSQRPVLEELYAEELQGHGLLLNRSNWRQFPRIFCLDGRTGTSCSSATPRPPRITPSARAPSLPWNARSRSPTACVEHGETDVAGGLCRPMSDERRTPCQIIQHNADVSLAWFEHMNRSWDMPSPRSSPWW